ncbi:GntR family transcriptional regulator [Streptomyces sp. NPDC079020]|uniref:GntR family transcriptional regulator n=1 Tax=Streptomyces sp. NPDC079020 TaxID=3365722 RepID=UPI0037D840FC
MGDGEGITTSARYLAPSAPGQGGAWGREAAAEGRRGSQRIVQAGEVAAPEPVADLLGLARGEHVVARRRIMYLDDEPCELTDTYYPREIGSGTGLAGTVRIPGGAVRLLADLGHVGVRAQEAVSARMPTESEREALAMGPGEPVLQLTRLTLDAAGRPVQADVMVMVSRDRRLRYEIEIG